MHDDFELCRESEIIWLSILPQAAHRYLEPGFFVLSFRFRNFVNTG